MELGDGLGVYFRKFPRVFVLVIPFTVLVAQLVISNNRNRTSIHTHHLNDRAFSSSPIRRSTNIGTDE